MTPQDHDPHDYLILGQKYAFATASLISGIACFINFLGLEKAILAILFAWLALRSRPLPALTTHRNWARAGLAIGSIFVVAIPTLLLLYHDRLRVVIDTLNKLQTGK